MSTPTGTKEYAFGGSLCCIREFETADGLRFCLTIFSLSDYRHLHFPHDEYKCLIDKLQARLYTETVFHREVNSDELSIKQRSFDGDLKVKFGTQSLTIGSLTAFGLAKTTPFSVVFSDNKNQFACDSKWDICACKACPVFLRLSDYEAAALMRFHRKPENVILFHR